MKKYIITIARQYGSGGGEIAKETAKLLDIPCYDKEIILKSSEDSGISREVLEKSDERTSNSFLYSLAMSSYSGQLASFGAGDIMMSDRVFIAQSEAIKKFARQSSCVIVGRCADYILEGYDNLIKLFVYAPFEERVKNIIKKYDMSEQNAKTLIKKTDKKRSSYYNFYTSKSWGISENYTISIDSSVLGIEKTASFIKSFIEML